MALWHTLYPPHVLMQVAIDCYIGSIPTVPVLVLIWSVEVVVVVATCINTPLAIMQHALCGAWFSYTYIT